ncbi:unnamed protein product [Phytophthora lilii]|uniref:Unnamed protein product n=1 Tax=Phytophthora lilii TaxID=2077276 RepID=A0A9W6U4A5_9STRA|nr:unnamed protein product [Phytophthora lilii]
MLVNLSAFSSKTALEKYISENFQVGDFCAASQFGQVYRPELASLGARFDTSCAAAESRDDTGSQEDHSGGASADSKWAPDSDGDRSSGAEIAECSDENASEVCDEDTRIILINDDSFPVRNSVWRTRRRS